MLTAYLHTVMGDWQEAADLAQETFILAYRKSQVFDSRRPAAPWLRGIARNLARNALRKRAKRPALPGNEEIEQLYSLWDTGGTDYPWEARLRVLDKCVERLPERQRQCVELHYRGNKPGQEVAALMGVKTRTVFQMLWQAREALRDCVERALSGGVAT